MGSGASKKKPADEGGGGADGGGAGGGAIAGTGTGAPDAALAPAAARPPRGGGAAGARGSFKAGARGSFQARRLQAGPPQPTWDPDIVQHAAMLGLSVVNPEDDEFMWIAEKAARDLMRPPWVRMIDEADDRVFYYNGSTKISTFTTPHLPEYKKLLRQRRQAKKQAEAAAAEVAQTADAAGGDGNKAPDIARAVSAEHVYVESTDHVLVIQAALQQRVTRIVDMPAIWGAVNEKPPGKLDLKLHNKQLSSLALASRRAEHSAGEEHDGAAAGDQEDAAGGGGTPKRGVPGVLAGGVPEAGSWWFRARLRCCQIPSVRACVRVVDRIDWENWLEREEGDGSNYDMVTHKVLALDLSVNHVSTIALGWLAAFPLLRQLDLSLNNLTSLDGIGVAFHLRELNVAQNKLGSYTSPVMARQGANRDLLGTTAFAEHDGGQGASGEGQAEEDVRKQGGLVANLHENILSKGGLEKLTRLRTIDASQNSLVSADIQVTKP